MSTSAQTIAATQEKAFIINMDKSLYGSFAEIGAGQETANWFFRSSGAAGTVAKTISAYDMTVSDTLYGTARRYVSEERLLQMMDYEYKQLINRLGEKRGKDTCFFAFCNTVKCKGYRDNGPWSAWVGVRFQLKPEAPPSDLVMHVRLLVPDHDLQMRLLGILGVNMLYALFYKRERMEEFVECIGENVDSDSFEIDYMRFSGHGFGMFDNRILALQLVRSGLSELTLFCPDGLVAQPSDLLYKRPIVLMRGSFMPLCNIHLEMMESVRSKFCESLPEEQREKIVDLCEISLSNLLRGSEVDLLSFLDRVDALAALGKTVMVTNITHFHRISTMLNQFTKEPIAIALSIGLLNELFKDKWADTPGGILASMGHIFINKTKFYVTPWINRSTGEFVTAGTYRAPEKYRYLYQHLRENGDVIEVPYFNQKLLFRTPRDIIRMISSGDEQWKEYVPEAAYRMAEHLKGGEA
ncbi:MAG: TonB-dependent receptor [Akkermansia sp.]|nr:TonB-dependent receptor [Akkermansiaceae bacterium]MBQ3143321.1 TonB-dependent receptor [Akkermansia sp.]